jgi:hypothetical protein
MCDSKPTIGNLVYGSGGTEIDALQAEIADLRARLAAAEAQVGALREVLRKIEWTEESYFSKYEGTWIKKICPVCRGEKPFHKANCKLDKSLSTPPPARREAMINALKLCREELRYAPCRDNPERTLCLKCRAEKVADEVLAELEGSENYNER